MSRSVEIYEHLCDVLAEMHALEAERVRLGIFDVDGKLCIDFLASARTWLRNRILKEEKEEHG